MATETLPQAILRSHRAIVRAEVFYGDASFGELPILSGSVSIDARRNVLRTCTLEVSPDSERTLAELFVPIRMPGAEVKLWRGVRFPVGPGGEAPYDQLVALGVFVVDDYDYNEFAPKLSLAGSDRSSRITRARFEDPYTIAAGTDLAAAAEALLTDRWAACPIGFDSAGCGETIITAQAVFEAGESSDPWKEARAIFEAHGFDLHFGPDGMARVRTIPDIACHADYTYGADEAAVVLDSSLHGTNAETYSGVIATGEGTGVAVPVRGEAWDMEPTSPTYCEGPFGRVPLFYSSSLLTTQAMADTAASTMLAKKGGRMEQIAWSQIVNPLHDALDVVDITDPDGSVHRYLLDQITIPLDVETAMSATARETRVA